MRDLRVSIVTHGTPTAELKKAVECLVRSPRIRTIDVLDNSGLALSEEYRKALNIPYAEINIEKIPNNGYGAGHNISMRRSLGQEAEGVKYHLVMNSDVWWESDIITPLCDTLDQRPEIGLIMPKVYYPDGALQLTARRLPTPWDVFGKRFLPAILIKKRIERYLLKHADHDKEIDSPYLLGSFMLFRTEALKDTGLFDERFFMYPEDIDISRRIHRNFKSIYYPGVSIVHEHRAASRKSFRMLKIHVINMIRYFNKWGWWIDSERRQMNRDLEHSIEILPDDKIPESRG